MRPQALVSSGRAGRSCTSADVAVAVPPVLLPQFALEHLAGAGDREGVGELDAAGGLVAGDEGLGVGADLIGGGGGAGFEYDDGVDPLAPFGVGYADDGAHRHRRVLGD